MGSNFWLDSLTYLEIACQVAVIGIILSRRLVRRWPSILASCIFKFALYAVLMKIKTIPHQYKLYFYVYFSGTAIHAIIQLWMVCDLLRSIPGFLALPRRYTVSVVLAGVVMAAGAFVMTLEDGASGGWVLAKSASLFDWCVNISVLALLMVLVFALWLGRFTWDFEGGILAYGVSGYAASHIVINALLLYYPKQYQTEINSADSVLYVAVLAWWAICLLGLFKAPRSISADDPESTEIARVLAILSRSQRTDEV